MKLYVLQAIAVPAQLTDTFSRPNLAFAVSIAVVTSVTDVTSTGTNTTLSPSDSATLLPSDDGRSQRMTLASLWANRSTVARPRPLAPPVTRATVFYNDERIGL